MLTILTKLLFTNRKRLLLALLVLAMASSFVYVRFFNTPQPATNTQLVDPKKNFRELVPGKSTHQQIIDQLGEPQSAYEQDGMTVYLYPSTTSYYAPDQLYVKGEVLQLKELFYTPDQFSYTLKRLTTDYGKPEAILYQTYSPYTANYVYAYPSQGVAAYITKEDKVFKLQHFTPTDLQTYRLEWGKDLFTSKPVKPDSTDVHIHQ